MNATEKQIAEMERRLAVMKAFQSGKPIEYRCLSSSDWYDVSTPSFEWITFDYRVKKVPIQRWIVWSKTLGGWGIWCLCPSELEAKAQLQRAKVTYPKGTFIISTTSFTDPEE